MPLRASRLLRIGRVLGHPQGDTAMTRHDRKAAKKIAQVMRELREGELTGDGSGRLASCTYYNWTRSWRRR